MLADMYLVNFFAPTQLGCSAIPFDWEARENPAGIMQACQAHADSTGLPVRYSNEMLVGVTYWYTFYPRKPTLETSSYLDRRQ